MNEGIKGRKKLRKERGIEKRKEAKGRSERRKEEKEENGRDLIVCPFSNLTLCIFRLTPNLSLST